MSDLVNWIKANERPQPLTDDEFHAVYDFVNANKDDWDWNLKEGLLKLLNAEEIRRL